jgi:hypothetical protein
MRIRTVKPEYWKHPIIGRASDRAKLLSIALLNMADDEGYFDADPAIVRAELFPFDDDSTNTIRGLDELSKLGWIEVKNNPNRGNIGVVVNFKKHQKIDKPSVSRLGVYYNSTNAPRTVDEASSQEQGSGIREQVSIVLVKEPTSTTKKIRLKQAEMPDGFKEFWDAYGKKVNVKKSIKYWSDMSTEEKAECMIAVPKYVASREKIHRLDPERYLRDKRWHDEIVTHAGTAHAQAATDSEWWVCRKLCARPEPKHKCPDGQCYTCRTEREVITAKDRDEAVAKMKEKIDRECAF